MWLKLRVLQRARFKWYHASNGTKWVARLGEELPKVESGFSLTTLVSMFRKGLFYSILSGKYSSEITKTNLGHAFK